jgi:hypothetical protein
MSADRVVMEIRGSQYEATFPHAHFTPEYVADKIGFEAKRRVDE